MFKFNKSHRQATLFSSASLLPDSKQVKLQKTKEFAFYELVFCQINEEPFAPLYSDTMSRPNSPVNAIVAALILKEYRNWSYEELIDQVDFDLRTRIALGLSDWADSPFCQATLFNFQNRLMGHYLETGEDLLEQTFDHLTADQLKTLKIKTNIQRSDSFLAGSNIRVYSRLQLLIEVLIRLYRVLSPSDQAACHDLFAPYLKQSSGQFVWQLKQKEARPNLETVGQVYHTLIDRLSPAYSDTTIFQIAQRIYREHFCVIDDKIEIIPADQLSSSILQSPDDIDATYRHKRDQQSRGQTIHVTETAHPDNQLNLLTDVAIVTNNTDDSIILNDRLDIMTSKTPDLDETHTDGGYGSEDNDRKMAELGIRHIQTAVKGRTAAVPMSIEQIDETTYRVDCPRQTVISQPTKTRFKACFEKSICQECPLHQICATIEQKQHRVYYFSQADHLKYQRHRAIKDLPPDRQKIRPNVEATVHEFSWRMRNGKLKVRGQFKTRIFAFLNGIGINFGRIFRFQRAQMDQSDSNSLKMLYTFVFPMMVFLKTRFRIGKIQHLTPTGMLSNHLSQMHAEIELVLS